MSRKGDKTKANIAMAARKAFAKKGFSSVTMQDICNASGMSRGGVYRHFDSTAQIFAYIIREEHEKSIAALKLAIKSKIKPEKIFDKFIRTRIAQVLDTENSIDNAIIEFASQSAEGAQILKNRMETSVDIVADILRICRREGVFQCSDPQGMARHILWMIEGMSKHNALIEISDEEVEQQIQIIYGMLKRE